MPGISHGRRCCFEPQTRVASLLRGHSYAQIVRGTVPTFAKAREMGMKQDTGPTFYQRENLERHHTWDRGIMTRT
jgi:hypothetical protein